MKVAKKHICMVVTRICTILVMLGCVQTINAGTTEMTYDPAGNLLTKLTSELKASISDKGCITYTYDHERLKEVLYPKNLFNRVTYTYGAPGDRHNRAGRLALVEDASGGEAYYYGRMGEVTKTVRTVMASVADIRTYVYGATYDSWNRVRTMTYPDGEVVTYHYNEAGQVESLTSNKLGRESVIIERTGYDKDGHTVYTKLGNGTETEYTYDDVRQRLQEMNLTSSGNDIMRNKYQYDAVDNILGISNTANPQSLFEKNRNRAKLGGASTHSYQYDELNRLIHATGKAKSASYDMAMTFNSMSMPISKVQTVDSTTTAQSYNNTYLYEDTNHPTAPTQIGHEHYEYDANGNPTLVTNDSLNTTRELYWDEDNRLMVLSDNGKTSRYTYNHAGERIVKSHGDMEGVYINGAPQGITFHETDEFTLYPAPIISVNKNRYTKHYFIGDKRIASRIGSGKFNNVYGRNGSYVTAGQQDYAERMNQIESQKEDYYKELGIAPGVPTMKGAYGDPENTGIGYNTIITELGDHSVPEAWAQYAKHNDKEDTTPGAPIAWDDPVSPEEPEAGYGYIADDSAEPEETFFYHSDHLGSTSYITDKDGNITQYDAYLPYGELLVDEHSSSEEMPYKFNGKELDEETGLYYYGARYMQPAASIWYGVDPLAEKYPHNSPYTYCSGNPMNRIDPNGMDDYKLSKDGHLTFWRNSNAKTTDRIYAGKKFITVNKTIRKQLMTNREDYDDGHYAIGGKEMIDIYSFLANNSKAEWALSGYYNYPRKGGKQQVYAQYLIRTSHDEESVSYKQSMGGMDESHLFVNVHSHTDNHKDPSGFGPKDSYKTKEGKLYMFPGDKLNAWDISDRLENSKKPAPTFYMYHIQSQTLVRYDKSRIYKKRMNVLNKRLKL